MTSDGFHRDLRAWRFLPRRAVGPRTMPLVRAAARLAGRRADRSGAEVVDVGDGVSVRLFRPAVPAASPTPALLWVHGGGMVIGSAAQDDAQNRRWADELGIVVASVEYRLAPEHPHPVPLLDCAAALRWLAALPEVNPGRVAVGGASAGGGLAAGLALHQRDTGGVRPVLQLLSYPMIDDRTVVLPGGDHRPFRLWDPVANRLGWTSYLGRGLPPGGPGVPATAAPARAEDLSDLPPAWIGVGTLDLFLDEDVTYAQRLRGAGAPADLHVMPGAYHGFDGVEAGTPVARDFLAARTAALAAALGVTAPR
ncbi:alpha/beta hydrolase [Kineococcus sp. SYSU DK004]|uniref:alpha/beta hydrolase n=1 Tax=Kineococcus sp. SYSU DK004 TaxID=3383125 RepID=UPI003D7DDFA8